MQLLKDRILTDGVVKEGNILKVDSFLNHQMDIDLINEVGKEFKKRFDHCPITKILTIEASGIGIACIAAQYFHVPVVFAKKAQSVNLDGEMYTTKVESFTHKKVYDVILSKKFLGPEDHVLLIDDFLANGCALLGLIDIVKNPAQLLKEPESLSKKASSPADRPSVTWVSIWNPLLSLIPLLMANLLSVNKIYHKKYSWKLIYIVSGSIFIFITARS